MNRPCIQRTKFQDVGKPDIAYGYRIYDDHGQSYNNCMSREEVIQTDGDFLRAAVKTFDEVASSIFDFALENGMYIDDNWYRFKLTNDGWELIDPEDEKENT